MSTRFHIASGDGWELYQELGDLLDGRTRLYLELVGDVDFRASPKSLTVVVPGPIWEQVRAHGPEHDPDD